MVEGLYTSGTVTRICGARHCGQKGVPCSTAALTFKLQYGGEKRQGKARRFRLEISDFRLKIFLCAAVQVLKSEICNFRSEISSNRVFPLVHANVHESEI
jgi:hypothetical protein